ncbi:MAG: hypothetical protein AB1641_21505 [Thermodesulfobacteriota bacterium]
MNVAFELGQKYKVFATGIAPSWFANIPIIENFENYFLKGTFSTADLAASVLGAALAFALTEISKGGKT